MSWVPADNRYDGVNSAPVNDVELNAPFYNWDFLYNVLAPLVLFAPLLTYDENFEGGEGEEEGSRAHCMRVMIVPPEKGRCC